MEIPNKINTGRQSIDEWIKKNYPDYYKYLYDNYISIFGVDIKAALYLHKHNMIEPPKCQCGKYVKFHGNTYGFAKYCCPTCAQLNKDVRIKQSQTLREKYGDNFHKVITDKSKQTMLDRYGVDNAFKLDTFKEKFKHTMLDRYGVDNPMKLTKCKEKSKQTCNKRYGADYWFTSAQYAKQRTAALKKSKQTCNERYGTDYATQNETVKQKISNTVDKKYGVAWSCMRGEAHNSRNSNSKPNQIFAVLLDAHNIKFEKEFQIGKFTYDFKVDDVLIEVNPAATHNINWNPFGGKLINKNYHLNKTTEAIKHGFRCIHIWDWDNVEKIISLLSPKQVIYARKCEIHEVNTKLANQFLNTHHIQGSCRGQKIIFGLYFMGQLVELMSFGKPRYDKKYEWELLRLCAAGNVVVIGGASKLLKHFIKIYNPHNIISYCDNSKFVGTTYKKIGFDLQGISQPSCHWYNIKTNQHILNSMLLALGVDKIFGTSYGKGTSNENIMLNNKFVQIYDCGQMKFVWQSKIN